MRRFAETFFGHFGARLEARADELVVDLPPELHVAFGKPRLYLVFPAPAGQRRELSPGEDLLVYGSRTFDQMLAVLAGRGEAAHLQFPPYISVQLDRLPRPSLRQGPLRLYERPVYDREVQFYIFNFRMVYVSDEKREEFTTIVLDSAGQVAPHLNPLLVDVEPLWSAPAEAVDVEPAMLRKLYDQARALVQHKADEQAVVLELEIRARLERVLLRLTGYYRRLSDEVETGDPAQDQAVRADLQAQMQQQVAAELERHKLRVALSPVSYAVAKVRQIHYALELGAPPSSPLEIWTAREGQPYAGGLPAFPVESGLSSSQYAWSVVKGETYELYVGQHWWRGLAFVAVDRANQVIYWETAGPLDWWRGQRRPQGRGPLRPGAEDPR